MNSPPNTDSVPAIIRCPHGIPDGLSCPQCPLGRATEVKPEAVDHPQHYGGDTPYEVIKVLEAWLSPEEYVGFLKGNVIKYEARAGKKDAAAQDAAKAAWYADRLAMFLKKQVE